MSDAGSIPHILDVEDFRGDGSAAKLLIEVPHGATETADFDELRAGLRGDYPDDLVRFFHVNTDVGAPELARAVGARLAAAGVGVRLLRGRIPRTFVDVNRVLGEPADFAATGLTPGLPPYVTDPDDAAVLRERHERYDGEVARHYADLCGTGGEALIIHSYAPRSVDPGPIDRGIVSALERCYEPGTYESFPLRPEVETIDTDPAGRLLSPAARIDALAEALAGVGISLARNRTYSLHPSTAGYHHAERYPGQVVCCEVRRDLLCDPFVPFRPVKVGVRKVERLAVPLADAFTPRTGAPRSGS